MHPGKYLYLAIITGMALLGLSMLAAMTADITVALLNDTKPVWTTGWGYFGVLLGTGSLITAIISTSKD